MPAIEIKVEGLEQCLDALKRVGMSMADPQVEKVLLGGVQIFRDEARRRAPVGATGTLKRSIRSRIGKPRMGVGPTAFTAIDRKVARHGHLVEEGTRPHEVFSKKGRVLRYFFGSKFGGGAAVFSRRFRHPGSKANPFFANAVVSKMGEVGARVVAGLQKLVEQAAKR